MPGRTRVSPRGPERFPLGGGGLRRPIFPARRRRSVEAAVKPKANRVLAVEANYPPGGGTIGE